MTQLWALYTNLLVLFVARSDSKISKPLEGHHLIISGRGSSPVGYFGVIRDATGHILQVRGIAGNMLDWLSIKFNVTFSPQQINVTDYDDAPGGKPGLFTLLSKNEYDVLVSTSPTPSRMPFADFTNPVAYIAASYIIPKPDASSFNLMAIINPLETWTWVAVLGSLLAVSLFMYGSAFQGGANDKAASSGSPNKVGGNMVFLSMSLLLDQAGFCSSKKLSIRIALCSWGMGIFILQNYYTADLTSYMAAPNPQPLIRSIYDLRDRPNIHVVTDGGTSTASTMMIASIGFMKLLGDRLRSYPKSNCPSSNRCVDLVKSGGTVYISGRDTFLITAMKKDFATTGRCRFSLGNEIFSVRIYWATRKHSPYKEPLNLGFMMMNEAGLLDKWAKDDLPDIHQCLDPQRQRGQPAPSSVEASDLRSLAGPFVVLLVCYVLATVVLTCEIIMNRCSSRIKRIRP